MAREPSRTDGYLFPVEAPEPEPVRVTGPFAVVALDRPVRREFTYRIPAEAVPSLAVGSRVAVPFGPRREVGVVVEILRESDVDSRRIKDVASVLDPEPLVSAELLELTRWIAHRTICSWGEALHAVLPAALKRERGVARVTVASVPAGIGEAELATLETASPKQHRLLRTLLELGGPIELRELCRKLNLSESPARTLARRGWVALERVEASADELEAADARRERPRSLFPAQQAAVDAVSADLDLGRHRTFLLQGVTGSGKTEVYLAVIERALALGRGAIVLVPEIALTPQTVGWFRSRFGGVAVAHSRMTDAQRHRAWRRVQRGEARVVVGARSAIFAPVERLGVIVVDEEHEPSFKQASVPRYHARDVAIERARAAGAVCVLGSATPALETWQAAREGRIERLLLSERISGHGLPPVEVIDMRAEPRRGRESSLFSQRLLNLVRDALGRKEQAILFQNRRGFAPVLWCSGCKTTVRCGQCDVSLTWHRRIERLVCHACCEESRLPTACPTCSKPGLRLVGAGSQRIEEELAQLLPAARVRRMDSDTMRRREDYEETLAAFGSGEVDVLVGTQMIAKGLDFPRVTVVGIVQADGALHLPDFRAAERTFQLVSQVSGRAGRGELEGRIVVQTTVPDHPSIVRAARHDFEGFAERESELRGELGYPPHGRLVRALIEDESAERVTEIGERCALALREAAPEGVLVLGPAPAPISLLRGRHRRHLLVKAPDEESVEALRPALVELATEFHRPRLTIDVDPVSLL